MKNLKKDKRWKILIWLSKVVILMDVQLEKRLEI